MRNTNSARKRRAVVALIALGFAGFISLDMVSATYIVKSASEGYNYGLAWTVIGWILGFAGALFFWNIVTYNRPRYARNRGKH